VTCDNRFKEPDTQTDSGLAAVWTRGPTFTEGSLTPLGRAGDSSLNATWWRFDRFVCAQGSNTRASSCQIQMHET